MVSFRRTGSPNDATSSLRLQCMPLLFASLIATRSGRSSGSVIRSRGPDSELVAAAVERSRYTATPARLTMLIAAKALAGPSALGSIRPPRRAISPGHSMSPRPVARFDTFCMTHVPADWSRLATRRSGMNLGPHVSVRDTPQEAFHTWSVQAQCPGTVLVTARDIETLAKRR